MTAFLREFNDRLLAGMGARWDSVFPLGEDWADKRDIQPFKAELITLLRQKFNDANIFAIKDPRISKLLPLWKDVLNQMGIKLKCLIVYRYLNPLPDCHSAVQFA